MKAVKWFGPKDMRMVDVDKPQPAPREALLRIESVGVCGSDMHYYLDGRIGGSSIDAPVILGHEYAGIVEAVGSEADPALVGKRVAVEPGIPCMQCESCRKGQYNVCLDMFFPGGPGSDGALSEYYCVHAAFCHPVPEHMSAAEAAMLEPAAVGLHTIELARLVPGDTVAIFGLGSIGLLTAQFARLAGAHRVYGADLLPYRVALAGQHGVDAAFEGDKTADMPGANALERILEATGGRGVDVAIDCTNAPAGLALSCLAAKPAGRVVLTGISGQDFDAMPVGFARRRELTLQWCRRFCHNFPATMALVADGRINVKSLLTHSFTLEETVKAFDLVAAYDDNVIKVSVDF